MNIVRRCGGAVLAVAGVAAVGAIALPAVAKADAPGCGAARVTGISSVLDTFATGSAAGPSVLFGVAIVPLSQPLPAPLDSGQSQALGRGADTVQQMRSDAPQQIDQARGVVAPLAGGNEFANQGVDATADGLDTVATTAGPAIAPGDTSLHEVATSVRGAHEAAPAAC
jgi:hypothetical protein